MTDQLVHLCNRIEPLSTVFSSPSSYIVFSCSFSPFDVSSGVIFYPMSSRSLIGAFMLLLTAEKYVIDSANNFSCPRFKYKALSRTDNPEYINISVYITMAPTLTDSPQLLTSNHGRNGWEKDVVTPTVASRNIKAQP